MKHYKSYMDRQETSPAAHEKLLTLEVRKKSSSRMWMQIAAFAACCVLVAGLYQWGNVLFPHSPIVPLSSSAGQFAAGYTPLPGQKDTVGPEDLFPASGLEGTADFHGFVVNSPVDDGQSMNFFFMPAIGFPDRTGAPQAAACRVYAPGSFLVDLEKEDIQKIFWGSEGIPETYQPEIGRQDLPWALFWDGYTVHGYAWYNNQGELMKLTIYGEKGRSSFDLELCAGALPFSCVADLDRGDQTSDVFGVPVASWSQVYDRDGDGVTDYICGSEFMTKSDIGVRFTSWNNGKAADEVKGEAWFNTLFVRQALPDGLYLDHMMTNENVPAWREEEFSTLAQARQEAEFAPYLPASEPEGYSAYTGNKEFYGRLSYQEGTQNALFVRWSRGYDNVEVSVRFPEDSCTGSCTPVDINVPASYDTRLYEIPWCDSVPQEYVLDFYSVTFRAQDMSLDAVQARETGHDTGGTSFRFKVLHDTGVVVSYSCDGLTAQQVWAMVKETLNQGTPKP